MKKLIRIVSAIALTVGFHAAWADDSKTAAKPGMGDMKNMEQGGMQGGDMKGMNMDMDHMKQMHEHMNDMHQSMDMNKGDVMCADKSDGKCAAKDVKKDESAKEKGKTPAKAKPSVDADDHAAHHQ